MGGADKGRFRLVLDNIHNRFLIPRCAHCSRQLQSFVTKASAFPPQKRGSHNHNLIGYVGMVIVFYSSPLHQADQQRANSMKNWDWGPNKDFYGMFSSIFATKTSVFKYIPLPQNLVILSAPNNMTASWSHLSGSHKSGASSSASNHQSNHNCFAWAFLFCLFSWNPNFPVWRVLPQMGTPYL